MSQINYNVWGNPETWTHWSASTTPTTETVYGQYRQGAAAWTDSDFENYPYFKIGTYVNLRNLVVNGTININDSLDNTLSYSAVANPDLPQYNRYIFNSIHHSVNDYIAKSNNPTPFSLAYYYRNENGVEAPCRYGFLYGFDGFPNNALTLDYGKMQRFSPFAAYDTTYSNVFGDYNPNLRIAPITEFGTKSIILEINVAYIDSSTTRATSKLANYLSQTSEWKQEHPVIMAYCIPYFRNNVNGEYSQSIANKSIRFTGICPIFYDPYIESSGNYDIYTYLTSFNYGGGSGCFPIFGAIIYDSFSTAIGVNVSRIPDESMSKTNLSQYALFYGADKAEMHYVGNDASGYIYGTIDLTKAENIEYILRGAAAYGMFFCTDIGTLGAAGRDSGSTERWIDPDMYLGIIRSDGMTYGDYTRGTTNKDQLQYGWKSSTETPFIPSENINKYSNQTRIKAIGHIDTMCDRYVLNANAVNALSVDLFTIMSDLSVQQTDWGDLIAKTLDSFLVQNPVDCIVSLKKYPVKEIPNTGDLTNIHYGRYSTGSAAGYPCTADVYTYAFTPKRIQPRFGNSYLDYEPHTSAELYIPYCGSISLKMCDILDKQLEPFLCVDYHTGQCTGFVMADGIVIETIQGTIAVDVPITGIQTATVESQLMQSANAARSVRVNQAFSAIEGFGKITLGAKFGGALGGATGFANAVHTYENLQFQKYQTDYDLTHTAAPQHIIGSSSSACGWIIDSDTARLILYYPTGGVIDDANPPSFIASKVREFGSIYGFATIESGTIGSYPGFTTATEMILDSITTEHGAPATDPEIEMIRSALAEGVIVPNLQ